MQNKPKTDWKANDTKKVQYVLKVRDILIFAIGVNEYLYVSRCQMPKMMWDALQTLNESTEDVKKSKINTLTQQYELRIQMEEDENISSKQMKFTHMFNKL